MKKNNFFLWLLMIMAFSCHPKKATTLISKWEASHTKTSATERFIASAPSGQCLKDNFNVETLKLEVINLEKKFAKSEKVVGKWKHLDLSTLPVPQANFLNTYGNDIGDLSNPDAIDYSGCSDVPCIFNRIYGIDNYVAGYVHYLWYLRLGHLLSADNHVPEQKTAKYGFYNGVNYPLSDYLYSKNELYGLWRTSLILQAPYLNLQTIRQIQRIPKTAKFDDKKYSGACGLAGYSYILLTDQCLTIYQNVDEGYLYHALIHEFSHHVDFTQGIAAQRVYRSNLPDYTKISGWDLGEYVDAAGVTRRKWKTVTSYAGTSLAENFAESLTMFRVSPDEAKRKMDGEHFKFVSKNYYYGKYFDKDNLLKNWIEAASLEIEQQVIQSTLDCGKKIESDSSHYFNLSDFSSPIMPEMLMCFGLKARKISSLWKDKFSQTRPEGCLTFDDKSMLSKWNTEIKSYLGKAFSKAYEGMQNDKSYLSRVSKYYLILTDKTIGRDAYIECYSEPDELNCYKSKLMLKLSEIASQTDLPSGDEKEITDMYLSYHPFLMTKDAVKKGYQDLINGNYSLITNEAWKTWGNCFNPMQNDRDPPVGNFFTINDGYMISSLYNCINKLIPEAIKRAVRVVSVSTSKVVDSKEELILSSEIKPHIINTINSIYESERNNELKSAKELMTSDKGRLKKQLLTDLTWTKGASDEKEISSNCKEKALQILGNKTYFFHLLRDLFDNYIDEEVCLNIGNEPVYSNWVKESEKSYTTNILDPLEDKVLSQANNQALYCLKKFPIDTTVSKIRFRTERDACLISEWPKIEDSIIEKALSDPLSARLKVTRESLKERLDLNRRRLQIKVLKEHFQ